MDLTKKDFVKAISEKVGATQKDSKIFLDGTIEVIYEILQSGGKLSIDGLGVLSTKHKEARVARNPQTGEEIEVEAKTVPHFKFGSTAKRIANNEVE